MKRKYSEEAALPDWPSSQALERLCEVGDFSCEGFKTRVARVAAVLLMSRDGKPETLCGKNVTGILIDSVQGH